MSLSFLTVRVLQLYFVYLYRLPFSSYGGMAAFPFPNGALALFLPFGEYGAWGLAVITLPLPIYYYPGLSHHRRISAPRSMYTDGG